MTRQAKRYDRQVLEHVLRTFEVRAAYATSWDAHHVALFGGIASEITSQAYQFELLDTDDLRPAPGPADRLAGLALVTATEADLPYLNGAGFLDHYAELLAHRRVRIARWRGRPVGIGLLVPHPMNESVIDLGMFTDEDVRRQGIGTVIIAEAARECLDRGLTLVAGCWAGNWNSRPTLEAAGLTCIGTIFRFVLDPDTFAEPKTCQK